MKFWKNNARKYAMNPRTRKVAKPMVFLLVVYQLVLRLKKERGSLRRTGVLPRKIETISTHIIQSDISAVDLG